MICKICGYRINGGLNGCFCPEEDELTNWLNRTPDPPLIRPLYYRFCHLLKGRVELGKWQSWNQYNHYAQWQKIIKDFRFKRKSLSQKDLRVEYKLASGEVIQGISYRDV